MGMEQPHRAYRLTFSYDGDDIQLVSTQEVKMRTVASDPIGHEKKEHGFSFELKDAADKTLYRRQMHDPTEPELEVFGEEAGRTMHRAQNPNRKGSFTVVVPAHEGADSVRLVKRHGPPGGQAPHGAAHVAGPPDAEERELGRFKVHS